MRRKISPALFFYLSLFMGCLSSLCYGKVVVWDMNGVLTETSKIDMALEIGIPRLALSFFTKGHPRAQVFKKLLEMNGEQKPSKGELVARYGKQPLPEAMCQWQRGEITGENLVKAFAKTNATGTAKATAAAMFTPSVLARHMHPIKKGLELFKRCRDAGNTMIILSNYDSAGFALLKEKPEMAEIFNFVKEEDILVSGKLGVMKPDSSIYGMLLARLVEIDRRFAEKDFLEKNCLFLDDQPENVSGAIANGVPSVLVKKKNYRPAVKLLEKRGFISPKVKKKGTNKILVI